MKKQKTVTFAELQRYRSKPAERPDLEITVFDLAISIIPGIVWVWTFSSTYLQDLNPSARTGICIAAWFAYLILGIVPYVCIPVAIGNGILYVMTVWTILDMLPIAWGRYVFKGIVLVVAVLIGVGAASKAMERRKSR